MKDTASHRWLCGALGNYDELEYRRLCELIGAPAKPAHAADGIVFHARVPPVRSTTDGTETWRWDYHGPTVTARPDQVALHTDESGVVPVFLYRGNGYALFSSSLDALARCLHRRLHVDWAAWSEILSCTAVIGQRTPFEEIRRLPPSTTISWIRDRLVVEEHGWPWAEETASSSASDARAADQIIDAVADAMRSVSLDHPIIPLSGGWDSRFLATTATRQGMSPQAVTVPAESGKDEEIEWARDVARQLAIEHTVLGDVGWEASFARVAESMDYLTSMHFWLLPLAEWLKDQGGVVVDGLGGHLIKGTFVPSTVFDDIKEPYLPIATTLSARLVPGELLSTPFAESARTHVDEAFRNEWERWKGHPAAPTLCVYRLRSIGGTVLSPMMLLAASAPVYIPFIQPVVARAALSVPSRHKVGGRFYRALLDRLGTELAQISSPHDTEPKQVRVPPVRSPAALAEAARLLRHPALGPLMGDTLRDKLAAGKLRDLIVAREGRRIVQGLALLSLWIERYDTQLADAGELPWAPRSRRVFRPGAGRRVTSRAIEAGLRTTAGSARDLLGRRD